MDLDVLIIVNITVLIYQDIKERMVNVFLLAFLGILLIFKAWMATSLEMFLVNSSINIVLVSLQLALAILFLKRSVKDNSVSMLIGKGDIVFLFALCFLFTPVYFMYNYVCGLLIGLLYYFFETRFQKKIKPTVPLIATLGISTIICFWAQLLNPETKLQMFSL